MTKWTHLAGIVRIDQLPIIRRTSKEEILSVFKTKMVRGSEGPPLFHVHKWKRVPIEKHDWEATDELTESAFYWGDLIISADLRDFGDDNEVKATIDWFKEACDSLKNLKVLLRQAVLLIEVEYEGLTVLSYDCKKENWIILGNNIKG